MENFGKLKKKPHCLVPSQICENVGSWGGQDNVEYGIKVIVYFLNLIKIIQLDE